MDQLFTIDAYFALNQLTSRVPFALSADGHKLALTLQRGRQPEEIENDASFTRDGIPRGAIGSRILLIDTETGAVEEPFPAAQYTSWGAQWSSDGTRLAAYVQGEGPACLGLWERATGSFRRYPQVAIRPFFGFEVPQWAGQTALVVKVVATQTQLQREQTVPDHRVSVFTFPSQEQDRDHTHPFPGWADGYLCNLVLLDLATGRPRLLAVNWRLMGWKVAPDAQSVAVFRYVDYDSPRQQFLFDVVVLPLDGGAPRKLASRVPQAFGIHFNWSPDCQYLAYTTKERGAKSGLYVVAVDGLTAPRALHDPDHDLALVDQKETPRWSEDGNTIYCLAKAGWWACSTDGKARKQIAPTLDGTMIDWLQSPTTPTLRTPVPNTLFCLGRTRQKGTSIWAVDMHSGASDKRLELAKSTGGTCCGMEVSDSHVYLTIEASDHAEELWQYSWDFQQQRQLSLLNPHLADVSFGSSRLLEYRAWDGTLQHAALLLPANYTEAEKVPVLVEVYGGHKNSNFLHLFGCTEDILHGQFFAAHGYAVLYPDMPMSDTDPLKQLPGLVLPAVTHLVDLGIADPARIGLMGQSYGGYCTLALLVQTNLFAAAVACAGCYDFVSEYLGMRANGNDNWLGWVESGQGRMGGTLWEKRASYIENSPVFYLDRVQTPVMLVCGSEDHGAPEQAEAIFVGLRRLGKKVELRRYEGEGHWSGRWSELAYRDLHEHVLGWFDAHFSSSPMA